jgi:hypothetical protein
MTAAAKKKDLFVKFPLWWAVEAAKAAKSPATLVCVHMLHSSWKARSLTFPLSNAWLEQRGVTREVKRRVLRDLEAAGLITVERRSGRSPRVSLVTL